MPLEQRRRLYSSRHLARLRWRNAAISARSRPSWSIKCRKSKSSGATRPCPHDIARDRTPRQFRSFAMASGSLPRSASNPVSGPQRGRCGVAKRGRGSLQLDSCHDPWTGQDNPRRSTLYHCSGRSFRVHHPSIHHAVAIRSSAAVRRHIHPDLGDVLIAGSLEWEPQRANLLMFRKMCVTAAPGSTSSAFAMGRR